MVVRCYLEDCSIGGNARQGSSHVSRAELGAQSVNHTSESESESDTIQREENLRQTRLYQWRTQ
jgi:hypothetical protein